jgi:hypothetical protein
LLGNFATLNLPLSKLLRCKLSSIFEIMHTIPTCHVENGLKERLPFTADHPCRPWGSQHACISHYQGISIFWIKNTTQFVGFPSLTLYPTCPHFCLASKCWHLHFHNPHHTLIFPQGFWTGEYENHFYMDEKIVKIVKK